MWTDQQILAALQSRDKDQIDDALRHLLIGDDYRFKRLAFKAVMNYAKDYHDPQFKDAFEEAVIWFWEKLEHYIPAQRSIASAITQKTLEKLHTDIRAGQRRTVRHAAVFDDNVAEKDPETIWLEEEKTLALETAIAALGHRCRELLTLWSQHLSFENIAAQTGLSKAAAKTATYDCRRKLNTYLVAHPKLLEILRPT